MIQRICFFTLFILLMCSSVYAAEPTLQRIHSDAVPIHAAAIVVEQADLVHTTQLLPLNADGTLVSDKLPQQLAELSSQLDRILNAYGSSRDDVVKLSFYVADADVRDAVQKRLAKWNGNEALPAVSYVATPLPSVGARVAVDAVFVAKKASRTGGVERKHLESLGGNQRMAHACLLPKGDVVYVSGQAQAGDLAEATRGTLEELLRTLKHLKLGRDHIVQVKCFMQPMSDVRVVNDEIAKFFGDKLIPPVSHVEWVAGGTRPIEIELIAHASAQKSDETVSFVTPPWMTSSPVFSRVARIHGDRRIYVSGLFSREVGDGAGQVRDLFKQMEEILAEADSDLRHLAKATYYVSDSDSSGQLNAIRPSIYDPKRPPAASKAMVQDVGAAGRSMTIDVIAAPK